MVIRGRPRGGGLQLAAYLLAIGENEAIHVFDIRGTSQPNDLRKSLFEMDLTSELTRSDKGLYHAQINPAYGEDKAMCREDWLRAADILETELKLNWQKRVMVLHEKNGRTHAHVVWERYDHDKKRMISDSYSRLAQDRARQAIERELGQQQTPHRNKRKPVMKLELTALWHTSENGQTFIREAQKRGYTVSAGQQRPFMVVDREGVSFDLVRQLDKIKTNEVRERLAGEKLPTDKEAIKAVREAQSHKSFLQAQETATDKIMAHQEKVAARQQERNLFNATLSVMQGSAVTITYDVSDKAITKGQEKATQMLEQAKVKQPPPAPTPETEKEWLRRHYKEQMDEALNHPQYRSRGLSL